MTSIAPTIREKDTSLAGVLEYVVPLVISCVPLAWLAALNRTFYFDWNIHLWTIAYTGEFFRQHLAFPATLNTYEMLGIPSPIFYGRVFYPIAGIVSSIAGAQIALLVVLLAVMWLQTTLTCSLIRSVYPGRTVAWAIAALAAFATYPLTNLYNRNAIPEFVAVSLLVSACALWLRALYTPSDRPTTLFVSGGWLALALSASIHPITAVLGGGSFAVLVLAGLWAGRRRLAAVTVGHALPYLLTLSPWLYATLRFRHDLPVTGAVQSVVVFSDSIDKWWVRLLPIPFDIRPLRVEKLSDVSTPYLDAQLNVGLLIVAGFLVFQVAARIRRGQLALTREVVAAGGLLCTFVLLTCASVSAGVWEALPRSAAFFQFAYRLVTYCDLALLLAVVPLLSVLRRFESQIRISLGICLAIAVAIMAQGVAIKFTHAAAIQTTATLPGTGVFDERQQLLHSAPYLPWDAYTDVAGFAGVLPDAPMVQLRPRTARHFGEADVAFSSPPSLRVLTNIAAFPWNRIVLDGRELPRSETYTSHRILSFALSEDASARPHLIGYKFAPDTIYRLLDAGSAIAWTMWLGGLGAVWWRQRRKSFDRRARLEAIP